MVDKTIHTVYCSKTLNFQLDCGKFVIQICASVVSDSNDSQLAIAIQQAWLAQLAKLLEIARQLKGGLATPDSWLSYQIDIWIVYARHLHSQSYKKKVAFQKNLSQIKNGYVGMSVEQSLQYCLSESKMMFGISMASLWIVCTDCSYTAIFIWDKMLVFNASC